MLKYFLLVVSCLSCSVAANASLRVVTELSPPHQTLVAGEIAGLSTDLVRATLAKAGVTAQIEVYPWARSFRIAQSRPDVLIYNMARTAEREAQFHWIGTVAAYQLGFVALSHRDDIRIKALSDAVGYTIAVQRDDLAANFLMQNGFSTGKQLVLAADITESWQLLLNGKVDLVVDDAVALTAMAETLSLPRRYLRFVYAIPELAQHTWLAASLETSPELVKRLQQAHSEVATTEYYQKVMSSGYRQ
ncbi:transporter substrate-binding domain-containing protein [Rheinheimera sp. YQF-2]|uniref:Transporter substrate-binding domain-containing protein n=1 Tax=Rheinheimera lutimaris TaxID=2740584 RepID=A0A7Y5AST2_9GAMM|nr:transporter substrate-binding domain-containing protein [Rheinheimera lutimaris]NRQ43868.1 transporter substrate-binding domain-containing protein [Rheinheimera lutimaris]